MQNVTRSESDGRLSEKHATDRQAVQAHWAEIQQLALRGSNSSLHSEACNTFGNSAGVIHSSISLEAVSLRASRGERVMTHGDTANK